MLPILQAFVARETGYDLTALEPSAVGTALELGLGPIVEYVSRDSAIRPPAPYADDVQSARLTAHLVCADVFEALERALAAAGATGCFPMLLKGGARALRYYPEPHLRTMVDVDLLLPAEQHPVFESCLGELGWERPSETPEFYEGHHHSVPFWHPRHRVWVEVHSRMFPPASPMADDDRFSPDAVMADSTSTLVGAQQVRVMNHERELVYTATRWAEMINSERGVFPILDAALLIRARAGALDWNLVCALVDHSWGATGLLLLLEVVSRAGLADVPAGVLGRLEREDRFSNRFLRNILHRLVSVANFEGRASGTLLTTHTRRIIWSTLVRPASPWRKFVELPINLAFPAAESGRFQMARVLGRLFRMVRHGILGSSRT